MPRPSARSVPPGAHHVNRKNTRIVSFRAIKDTSTYPAGYDVPWARARSPSRSGSTTWARARSPSRSVWTTRARANTPPRSGGASCPGPRNPSRSGGTYGCPTSILIFEGLSPGPRKSFQTWRSSRRPYGHPWPSKYWQISARIGTHHYHQMMAVPKSCDLGSKSLVLVRASVLHVNAKPEKVLRDVLRMRLRG